MDKKDKDFIISLLQNAISILKEDDEIKTNTVLRDKIIEEAKKHLGKPYVYASDGPDSFDCSGFVQYVYKAVGIIPGNNPDTNSLGMRQWGKETTNPRMGDIICYEGHVAIYLNENQIIHASSGSKKIIIASKNIGKPVLMYRNVIGD